MPVETPSAYHESMMSKWKRCRDTFDGGDAVKKADEEYLPMLPSHDAPGYDAYQMRATFLNAMARTVAGLVGGVFQKNVDIAVQKHVEPALSDVTMAGESFEQFAAAVMVEDLITGGYGVLIDMPSDGGRPYMVRYRREDIISVKKKRTGGDEVLIRVVLREMKHESDPDDPFVLEAVEQFRVLEMGGDDEDSAVYTQTVWRKAEKDKSYTIFEEPSSPVRAGTSLSFIPFVLSTDKKPPLVDLADVNLSHYRLSADLAIGLHMVALPTPYVSGLIRIPEDGKIPIGPQTVWMLGAGGSAGMCEFSGAGLNAISDAMSEKKREMAMLGARLLEEGPGASSETAYAVASRNAGEQASLRKEAGMVESDLTLALRMFAWWMGVESEYGEVDAMISLNKDFVTVRMSSNEVQVQFMMVQSGELSFETFWGNLQRGGVMPEGRTHEEEKVQIGREGGGDSDADGGGGMPFGRPQ